MSDNVRAPSGRPNGRPSAAVATRRMIEQAKVELDAAIEKMELADKLAGMGARMLRDDAQRHLELAMRFLREVVG